MTVKELIELLSKYSSEAQVAIPSATNDGWTDLDGAVMLKLGDWRPEAERVRAAWLTWQDDPDDNAPEPEFDWFDGVYRQWGAPGKPAIEVVCLGGREEDAQDEQPPAA